MSARRSMRIAVGLITAVVLWAMTADHLTAQTQRADDLDTLNGQIGELQRQAKYAEAAPIAERYAALARQLRGEDHLEYGNAIVVLASIYRAQGRYAEAEPLMKRALVIAEMAKGPYHPLFGFRLTSLAELYRAEGRFAEAEPLATRALRMAEAFGPDAPEVCVPLNILAGIYEDQRRYTEAEPLYKRALAIAEKVLESKDPDLGATLNNLAGLYYHQGRYTEAEPLALRALAITEASLDPYHPSVGLQLNNLAEAYRAQRRYAEAEPLMKRALAILEKALGPDHLNVRASVDTLAYLYFAQQDWWSAAEFWKRSTALLARRTKRNFDDVGRTRIGNPKSEAAQSHWLFWGLVKAAHRIAVQDPKLAMQLTRETFEAAQWAQGMDVAASLAQMASRGAKGNSALAALIRERQDLVGGWQERDAYRSASMVLHPGNRDRVAEAANAAKLAEIDARISDIDRRLKVEFVDYAGFASPEPLSVAEVQTDLRDDEALILTLDTPKWEPTPEETFIWVVTKKEMRWIRSDVGTEALKREVAALRCGLDAAAWEVVGAHKCTDLVATDGNSSLTFDIVRAHRLYQSLFAQVEDLIRDKHLLIVPSGPLTQLPFQVLVTAAPAKSEYRSAAWLIRSNPITVLPAVSSLKALRRVAKTSGAPKPMIGVGNPLLDGNPAERAWEAEWAKLAREKQVCEPTRPQRVVGRAEKRRGVRKIAMRGARADLQLLRSQAPLYDTADELCAVAKALRLPPEDILLGARATEANIKKLSSGSRLAAYRVVHFATHGVMAGELEADSEPGLILTPPQEQSDLDDGYLSASEVSSLKLDADWVILSACNTAAGGSDKAEALSGLARAFFYAGARSLLVSHWAVNSAATVKLVTTAVGATARDKKLGRAEALRRAMLAMINKGEADDAHPANWAPFVLVGEGAAAK